MQLTATLDESLGERIAQVPGVQSVIGGLVDVISFEQFDLFFVLVNGWDPRRRCSARLKSPRVENSPRTTRTS